MSVKFCDSETKVNLMRAFAGESQARNRYVFSADFAKKEHLHVIEQIFRFTAIQEQQHAKIFYNHLQELNGNTIVIDAGYPVDNYKDVNKLLRAAQHNEYEEHDDVYHHFGEVAASEGFDRVAASFRGIAQIEKVHGDRFGRMAQLLEEGKLFVSDVETGWMCLKCGYVHRGTEAPKACPVCQHDQGYFIRLDLLPGGMA
ncbi:MAG: rubrerythrin family protein [Lachnospiraceae bacterium]|nr:rubrerythrin family protein [Lachnospiraceae bacterium]